MIAQTHTVIDPRAMVVEPRHTLVTRCTVLGTKGAANLWRGGGDHVTIPSNS